MTDQHRSLTLENWLRQLESASSLSESGHNVIQASILDPETAAFASSRALAERAGVNVATVTRTAQSLGFEGWPQLRMEIRARYLKNLSASDLAEIHRAGYQQKQPADAALDSSLGAMRHLQRTLDRTVMRAVAKDLARAKNRLIFAPGSFYGVGYTLAHNMSLAGYYATANSETIAMANLLSRVGKNDVLVAIDFWRLYQATIAIVNIAKEQGATIIAISDSRSNKLTRLADRSINVPAESASHFPSLVAGQAAVEGICAELFDIHLDDSRNALAAAEKNWKRLQILQVPDE